MCCLLGRVPYRLDGVDAQLVWYFLNSADSVLCFFFFFNDPATPEISPLSLHDALPILAPLENPRSIGQALRGSELGEFWKYRVGDYRLICKIEDDRLLILVLRVGHRKERGSAAGRLR